jgi:hypothetical protein
MRYLLSLLLAAALFSACGQDKKPETQSPTPAAAAAPAATLQSLPIERLEYLWENCDFIDYVFYTLPLSMSLDNKPSIQNALTHVASEPAPLLPQCKSIGRLFFVVKGENVEMAELYFSPGCTYYVWLKDDKPAYSNYMTPQGVQYLNNVLSQAGIKPEQIK